MKTGDILKEKVKNIKEKDKEKPAENREEKPVEKPEGESEEKPENNKEESSETKEQHHKFYKLTPIDDDDKQIYREALDYIFDKDNSDIRNIAISGNFGSGKSSIINSYEKAADKKFLHISCPHFEGAEDCKDEDIIENKIVTSLAQQIPAYQIPNSKYKVKADEESFIFGITFCVLSIVVFIFYFSSMDRISDFITNYYRSTLALETIPKIGGLLALIALISFGYLVYCGFNSKIISKVNLKHFDVELELNNQSFFDRNIDEILYLISNAECDGFVFEDIDRFKNIRVTLFEHLRELCCLANERLELTEGKGRTIRFFYLVSNETFKANDRAKFFDYNISVIPVVAGSNSYSKFKQYLKEAGAPAVDDHFLRGLSLYIDDLRLAKNIVNDYVIYSDALKILGHKDNNKLLAMLSYKNAFPDDYARLEYNNGYLYSFFQNAEYLRNSKLTEKMDDINWDDTYTDIQTKKMFEMIDSDDEFELLIDDDSLNNIRENRYFGMLKFLLRNGYIEEESYDTYMSYFDKDGISLNDKSFLMAVKERRETNYDDKLDAVGVVYDYLSENDFSKNSIKNKQLIDYLFSDECPSTGPDAIRKKRCIKNFITQIKENTDVDFIYEFCGGNQVPEPYFIVELIREWDNFLDTLAMRIDLNNMCEKCDSPEIFMRKKTLNNIIDIYVHLRGGNPHKNTVNSPFRDYVSDKMTFDNAYLDWDEYVNAFIEMGIKLSNLKDRVHKKEYLEKIFENGLYTPDDNNLSYLLEKLRGKDIKRMEPLDNLRAIEKDFWPLLVKNGKISPKISNLVSYYNINNKLDEDIIKFINDNAYRITFFDDTVAEEEHAFFNALINCNDINRDAYERFIYTTGDNNFEITNKALSNEKVSLLINGNLLSMSEENLKIVRKRGEKLFLQYVEKNIGVYIAILKPELINKDELKLIEGSSRISEENKKIIHDYVADNDAFYF